MATGAVVRQVKITAPDCCGIKRGPLQTDFFGRQVRVPASATAAVAVATNVKQFTASASDIQTFKYRSKSDLLNAALKSDALSDPVALETGLKFEIFEGLGGPDTSVSICETRNLPAAISLDEAMATLRSAIFNLQANPLSQESGTLRLQVPLPPGLKALQWLQSQPQHLHLLPRSYFSPRAARGSGIEDTTSSDTSKDFHAIDTNGVGGVAGVGSAVLFKGNKPFSLKDWKTMRRFLSISHPIIRAYGAMRFNPETEPSKEWQPFGSFYFFIPQIELCECEGCSLLAVNVAWDNSMNWTIMKALNNSLIVMQTVSTRICPDNERPLAQVLRREHVPDEPSWHDAVEKTLQLLCDRGEEISDNGAVSSVHPSISKVVMARRTKLELDDQLDPVSLLACLQEKDPSAYQFAIQVPDGSAFIGSSPERLFARDGLLVASEAVAGTRARGSGALKDFQLGMELMLSTKDHHEFDIVRESVKRHMKMVCKDVETEVNKCLIKQERVQHLYARFNGELADEAAEFDLLSVLHPTPAVCGHPQAAAKDAISTSESFDRGLYAGPVGWVGGGGAEFAVGIRSSLIQPGTSDKSPEQPHIPLTNDAASKLSISKDSVNNRIPASSSQRSPASKKPLEGKGTCIFLYAGVGIVKDSKSSSEWRELELKTSQFEALLEPRQPLEKVVNMNALWAKLIVEECCRLGITYFCIAPGSRSSPIAAAAAANPRITCVPCIDERSMGFHAVGYGRGANKAAALITSSGTAVSNLLPAVVESSQDFVPLLIITADRPAELHDSGANQTIDQGKHFAGFVRYHANLPAADDKMPARMVLTTVDSAVNKAMSAPSGPVHINIGFREPLAGTPQAWNAACLKGLERWIDTAAPYTQYIDCNPKLLGGVHPTYVADLEGIAELLESATEGMIIVGGLSAAEETWAVALLAQHLGWPVVPDILSGLRIGKVMCSSRVGERKVNIIHNFDQVLLSSSVAQSLRPDVVLQIGSRLTSKRLSQFLEAASPEAYIIVEEHSSRHDPSHIVTHRVQSSAADFSYTIMNATGSKPRTSFCSRLQILSEVVQREVFLRLQAESSLTEPYVAHYVVSCLPSDGALFLGNSMPIRDSDMYAHGALNLIGDKHEDSWEQSLPHLGARVGANRGASGIDGVLSTAIGFAAGSRQRVTLLVGDVSFLHDTNGLTLLSERVGQPPVTVVVVNNRGGGIFSLLPVAETMPEASFTTLFTTPHTVELKKLCQAHSVDHWYVKSKEDLKTALQVVQRSPLNCVIEVESTIEENADFHRFLQVSIGQAVTRAFHVISLSSSQLGNEVDFGSRISDAEYIQHRFALKAPPTTKMKRSSSGDETREGFLVRVTLFDGTSGIGEIVPLEGLHEESLLDAEEQLRVVITKLKGLHLLSTLALLNGSFGEWFTGVAGIQEKNILPSVRMGLEMALLAALGSTRSCSLLQLLCGVPHSTLTGPVDINSNVRVCGLLDSEGSAEDVAEAAADLVKEGFCTLKLKVGRRSSPLEDADVLKTIRKRVGPRICLRADANRKWSLQQALLFAESVPSCGLQFLEEPVRNLQDLVQFCKQTLLPVALDETLDENLLNVETLLPMFARIGVVAVVIKPSRVGGFEHAYRIAQYAQLQGMMVVISSAFESSMTLATLAQFAAYVDWKRLRAMPSATYDSSENQPNASIFSPIAHGLGTYKWLKDDPQLHVRSSKDGMEICCVEAAEHLECVQSSLSFKQPIFDKCHLSTYIIRVNLPYGSYSFHIKELGSENSKSPDKKPTLLFLHGFLGNGEDWLPVMDALSLTFRCISVDLPGHGHTAVETSISSPLQSRSKAESDFSDADGAWSVQGLASALSELAQRVGEHNVILVGYSMGARIALHMALNNNQGISAAVVVSGSPGLHSSAARDIRAAHDDALAASLCEGGIHSFVDTWYSQPMWKSLRAHPDFELIKRSRVENQDVHSLAKSLSSFSTGRQRSLWGDLSMGEVPLLFVVGQEDTKFVGLAHQMVETRKRTSQPRQNSKNGKSLMPAQSQSNEESTSPRDSGLYAKDVEDDRSTSLLVIEGCGHNVPVESPLRLVKALREFATTVSRVRGK
ncbi:menaquinone-specific isochorismate synthase [Marchantia polymorpha subsp. ruderalis]